MCNRWRYSCLPCTMTIQLSPLYAYVMFRYVYSSASLSWTLIRHFVETLKQTFGQHYLSQDNTITRMFRSEIRPSWSWSYDSWINNYICNPYLSPLKLRIRIPFMAIKHCDKVCQWLATGRWFSPGTPVSSSNKTDRHWNIVERGVKHQKSSQTKPKWNRRSVRFLHIEIWL
jgi:hypothetical protein